MITATGVYATLKRPAGFLASAPVSRDNPLCVVLRYALGVSLRGGNAATRLLENEEIA